jgi:hypothetical protein
VSRRNIGPGMCQDEWNKEKFFLFCFFLAKKFEKDYDNHFRIIIGKFFSSLLVDLRVELGWRKFSSP